MTQPALGLYCATCRHMRPGSTMHDCIRENWTRLVFPYSHACEDYQPGRREYIVDRHGLIVEKKEASK